MALTLDTLNGRVAQLAMAKGGEIPLYSTDKPLITLLRKQAKDAGGLFLKRPFVIGTPNVGTNLTGEGFDIAPSGQNQVLDDYQVQFYDFFLPINISQKAMNEATDDLDGADGLIANYVGGGMSTFWDDVEHWILTGSARPSTSLPVVQTAAKFSPLQTFNGAITWTGLNGTDGGLFQLAAPASQTGNCQGAARSALHSNQYGVGTGWAAGTTRRILDSTISRCSQLSGGARVDVAFMDSISWATFSGVNIANVRVDNVAVDQGTGHNYLTYRGIKFYDCINLDTEDTAYNGTTASSSSAITGGVIYLMPTARMEYLLRERGNPKFADISPTQAVVTGKFMPRQQILTGRLPSLGAVAGTRIP